MEKSLLLKVWTLHRTKKACVVLSSEEANLVEKLILKANEKLQINGCQLVLESDGTLVDDDECLKLLNKEIFIVLQQNEIWLPQYTESLRSNDSFASTVTLLGSNESVPVVLGGNESLPVVLGSNESLPIVIAKFSDENATNCLQIENPEISLIKNATPTISFDQETNIHIRNPSPSEDVWRKFELPWSKLSGSYFNLVERGEKFKDRYTEIVRVCIDELRLINTSIPYIVFKRVAHKIIEKYPGTFLDTDDDGIVLGDGTVTLVKKMTDRNNYLNKPHKRKIPVTDSTSIGKKKKMMAAKAGCSYWQPEPNKEETPETMEEKIKTLNTMDLDNTDIDQLKSILELTYHEQRTFLNREEPPTIQQIREEWPVIIHIKVMEWHFEKLTQVSLSDLESVLRRRCDKLLQYGKIKKICDIPNDYNSLPINEKCFHAIQTISKLLKEKLDGLFKQIQHVDEVPDIQVLNPYVAILNASDGNNPQHYLIIEKEVINKKEPLNFFDALKLCFASYYIFNMKYPTKSSATLEFIQRYLMKIHPDKGTKSSTFTQSKKKVINLLKNLADYDLEHQ